MASGVGGYHTAVMRALQDKKKSPCDLHGITLSPSNPQSPRETQL
jgi:hypothetical protein